jgi:hypothetical protein
VDCEEFKKIRHLHIILNVGLSKIYLEKSDDNIKPEDVDRKYMTDVFNAFPAVSFTLEYWNPLSSEKAIQYHKKYPNAVFKFDNSINRTYSAFCEHLE